MQINESLKLNSTFRVIRFFDQLIIVFGQPNILYSKLFYFFSCRGIELYSINSLKFNLLKMFKIIDFISFRIKSLNSKILHITLGEESIREYKRNLKNIIKSFSGGHFNSFLNLINLEIDRFIKNFCLLDNWNNLAFDLDIYVYKIIWRFMKRRHSKRSRLWIFSKYWKNFGGIWRFFCVDKFNNTYFLKLHSFLKPTKNVNLPSSLNIFDLKDSKKFLSIIIRNYKNYFHFNLSLFYKQQRGLCELCHSPLNFNNFKLIRLSLKPSSIDFNSLRTKQFYLVHSYCYFLK